ncbi:flagellar basal body-associated FliL family protein [bacterium]|nr:flagellar basal body-associated FliL family protein [bacterium]
MADEEGGDEGKGGSKKLLIIIVALILLIGAGAAAAYFIMFPSDTKDKGSTSGKTQNDSEKEDFQDSQKQPDKLEKPLYTSAKKYVVNLRDGRHFLTLQLVCATEDQHALDFLTKREPILDDLIISLLSNKTSEDLQKDGGKDLLRKEIRNKVNNLFTEEFFEDSGKKDREPVKRILFTEFILN